MPLSSAYGFRRCGFDPALTTTTSTGGGQRRLRRLRLRRRRGPISFVRLFAQGEEPLDTGGGRDFLPRCLFWSSGHSPAPVAPGKVLPRCAQLLWCKLYVMKDLQTYIYIDGMSRP